ncbi:serine-rich adhesin for platelets-like [Eurosta solidaginis]|uniref:serine-rich adhesin for platelets-like n=1 Tax=Eurosta solidaginis TaxID=178769 RepID=UPI0035314AB3
MDNITTTKEIVGKELDRNKNQHPQPQHQPQPQRQEQHEQQEINVQSLPQQQQQSKRNKLVRTTQSLGNTFSAALKVQQANIIAKATTITTAATGANSKETGYATTNATATAQQSTASTTVNAVQRLKDGSADVMGGGFLIRPLTATSAIAVKHFKQQQSDLEKAIVAIEATTTSKTIQTKHKSTPSQEAKTSTQMQEKLLENIQRENVEEKFDKVNKNKGEDNICTTPTNTANTRPTSIKSKGTKTSKETRGKFAEKLRRSFRRGEHKSLEIKRREPSFEGANDGSQSANHTKQAYSPEANNSQNHFSFGPFGLRSQPTLQRNSQSIFSFSQLPGGGVLGGVSSGSRSSVYSTTSGGHINPALLLDSPDVDTPPEYGYHHLSSVGTTNSSTSLESNFGDIGERTSSQSSISYWAWHQSNSSMGGEVSTNSSSGGAGANGTTGIADCGTNVVKDSAADNRNFNERNTRQQQHAKLKAQSSSKSDTQHQQASRSCSITSESSSTKLTRLQNFLFKSSNESTRSFHAHSNEGFTASSQYSSSGEWENLGFTTTSGSGSHVPADFYVGSFPEESNDADGSFTAAPPTQDNTSSSSRPILKHADSSEAAGPYYQYTLTSPNNPFLPEIIARSYQSSHEEDNQIGDASAVGHSVGGGGGTHSAQLPTPAYSRAGSQESTHSDSAIPAATTASSCSPAPHSSSPASSSSSTPGRQRRKLFILNSPTRHLLHQQPSHKQQQQHQQSVTDAPTIHKSPSCASTSGSSFIKSLNPFLPIASDSNCSNAIVTTTTTKQQASKAKLGSRGKRTPLKQSAVTSPIGIPHDLNAKREEFLRATMKICLVVSPPTSKLQYCNNLGKTVKTVQVDLKT